jgi:hypothetical protein
MYVGVDARKEALIVTIASESKLKHNPVAVVVSRQGNLIFSATIFLQRIFESGNLISSKNKVHYQEECKGFRSFIPQYIQVLEIPCNLEGCFNCFVKISDPKTAKLLESRSFMTQGT